MNDALPLVPEGNPFRVRGFVVFAIGVLLGFLLMAADRRSEFGAFWSTAAVFTATVGIFDWFGTFDDPRDPKHSVALAELTVPLGAFTAAILALVLSLRAAVAGVLPSPVLSAALLVTGASLGVTLTAAWLITRLRTPCSASGPRGSWSSLYRSPGLWLLAIAILLYVPMLGSFGLIDPWETHYGEVAREMLARSDWLSLWWAHEGWFFSKPVLSFWLQGLSFLFLGVQYEPGRMLASAGEGHFPQPEWAARLPLVVLSLLALYLAYRAVAAVFGARAGFLGGFVLLTSPYWFFLSRQSMTDMTYVAPLTGSIALMALGLSSDPEKLVEAYEIRFGRYSIRLSAAHVVMGAVIVTALPQITYLASRNLSLYLEGADRGFRIHGDLFFAGSGGGNCGLPGNDACRTTSPAARLFQPAVGAALWSVALALFLLANRGERRVSRLCYLGGWYLAMLALLAKGAPGLLLPLLVLATVIASTKRFRDFVRIELPGSILLFACVALPWYAQAFARHGPPFTDRLLFHDMYKRAFVHVHDTNAGDDVSFGYYIWQLGYGLFPWTGLALAGLVWWLTERDEAETKRAELGALLALWAVLAFSMFSVSLTKFHHYALPIVPPLCLLTGILLSRMLDKSASHSTAFDSAVLSLLGFFAAGILLLVGRDLYLDGAVEGSARLLHLFVYNYRRAWPEALDFQSMFYTFTIVAACAFGLLAVPRLRRYAVVLSCLTAISFTAFGVNVYLVALAPHWSQRETLLTYYSTRQSEAEPLVAFQMNWKGENFYSGNQLATFVTTGQTFKRWIRAQRDQGVRVVYVTTEHSRRTTLENELGSVKSFSVLTGPELNNKFFLARVEL